ncbi:hypothetical protein PM3016_3392 [Paenibacillus mucilaginosus 3016]|uniref:Aminoglycoside phosphotransferase domain-containing protein n=1 Tax=Paenibacillus mucilaginosus 3016 TaxID=1116391 RepID=H6NJT1_9BACL|nr:aminoglycoside phosphotransferase family protein [Paenibacillus mucilaginosus]AFC30235.1 hypothetical protein PM3016_3392 [Paenibacillus mucilaginosus 3016]WFA18880.1 aminoglycoside phosphotransferase family protein [Paenibacillus mucilaginosus]
MKHTLPDQVLAWVVQAVHPKAAAAAIEQLQGGVSSLVHRITLRVHGEETDVVLRLFHDEEWVSDQPDLAVREAESLRHASRCAGVQTPKILAIDKTGAHCGVPAVLMSRLPGRVVLQPPDPKRWVEAMAEAISRIHEVEAGDFPWSFSPYCDASKLDTSSWSKVPDQWKEAARIVTGPRPTPAVRFIHRDYHPANVLWTGEEVSGIVDWVNGCTGPAGIDVGHCRVNLALLHDAGTADAFLSSYQEHAGDSFVYDPYWDLVTLIDFAFWPPEVYRGWTDLGMTGLTDEMMGERLDLYLLSVLKRVL